MPTPYHEAHSRMGELHKDLAHLTMGEARRATELLDEIAYLTTEMSRYWQDKYPVEVGQLRREQRGNNT